MPSVQNRLRHLLTHIHVHIQPLGDAHVPQPRCGQQHDLRPEPPRRTAPCKPGPAPRAPPGPHRTVQPRTGKSTTPQPPQASSRSRRLGASPRRDRPNLHPCNSGLDHQLPQPVGLVPGWAGGLPLAGPSELARHRPSLIQLKLNADGPLRVRGAHGFRPNLERSGGGVTERAHPIAVRVRRSARLGSAGEEREVSG
jgi:hypothetical protein